MQNNAYSISATALQTRQIARYVLNALRDIASRGNADDKRYCAIVEDAVRDGSIKVI